MQFDINNFIYTIFYNNKISVRFICCCFTVQVQERAKYYNKRNFKKCVRRWKNSFSQHLSHMYSIEEELLQKTWTTKLRCARFYSFNVCEKQTGFRAFILGVLMIYNEKSCQLHHQLNIPRSNKDYVGRQTLSCIKSLSRMTSFS